MKYDSFDCSSKGTITRPPPRSSASPFTPSAFTSAAFTRSCRSTPNPPPSPKRFAAADVGPWFQCVGAGCVQAGTHSLAVVSPGTDVRITVGNESGTVHTFTSLVYPTGAQHMPFDQPAAFRAGSRSVTLNNPGLYVFVCKVHPFMLAATIVDDPATTGLDLGENVSLVNGITVPTTSDLATRLLRAFWLITNPANYQDHNRATNPSLTWTINYPAGVPLRITGG